MSVLLTDIGASRCVPVVFAPAEAGDRITGMLRTDAMNVGTVADVDAYTEVLRRLTHDEMFAAGNERARLAVVAGGIAIFLRRRPWIDDATRQAALSLADRAEEIEQKCFATPFPRGQS